MVKSLEVTSLIFSEITVNLHGVVNDFSNGQAGKTDTEIEQYVRWRGLSPLKDCHNKKEQCQWYGGKTSLQGYGQMAVRHRAVMSMREW